MKNIKKKILAVVAGCIFAGLMMLNINTSINETDFSVTGLITLAYGATGGGGGGTGGVTCYSSYMSCPFLAGPCWNVFLCDYPGDCQADRTRVREYEDPCD